jgi:hypothetical protein
MDNQLDLSTAVERLQHRDEYKYLLWVIDQERERYIAGLSEAKDPDVVMKLSGRISATNELLDLLSPSE